MLKFSTPSLKITRFVTFYYDAIYIIILNKNSNKNSMEDMIKIKIIKKDMAQEVKDEYLNLNLLLL